MNRAANNYCLSGKLEEFSLSALGECYRRYRLIEDGAVSAMARSLREFGQISPVVVCMRGEQAEVIDGFKRLLAARELKDIGSLFGRVVEADESGAKVVMYTLNRASGGTSELEQARIVHSLVREDGFSQVEVGQLLGRHNSWVSRRLALIEQLSEQTKNSLEVGLISATACRQIARLPQGKQDQVCQVSRQQSLNCQELRGVVDLLLGSQNAYHQQTVLEDPRLALRQAKGVVLPSHDPRLSSDGNKLSKRLGLIINLLSGLHSWFENGGRERLTVEDRLVLKSSFQRVATESREIGILCECEAE